MPFIGNKPSAIPLTSADLADSIITSAKIADGTIVNADINASAGIVTSKLSGALGITEADQWRLNADFSTGGDTFLTTNLERIDNTGFGYIGTGMTESSGVFTFPSTGIYKVEAIAVCALVSQDTLGVAIYITTNNSTYNIVANSYHGGAAAGSELGTGYGSFILDVTDTANVKVKFQARSIGTSNLVAGNTSQSLTHFNFIRLGDT
jgi:hypothetical protein